jgi:hypothetical protein
MNSATVWIIKTIGDFVARWRFAYRAYFGSQHTASMTMAYRLFQPTIASSSRHSSPDDRQCFIAPFQQTTARQHAQQIDHDENAVGVDDQRIQIDIQP